MKNEVLFFHWIFQLPCLLPEICEGLSSRVAFDQMAGLVALCTEDYRVQLYSLFDDREISEVMVR